MSANPQHPFDREDSPRVITFGGSKVAIRPPQSKSPERDTIRRELDRVQRQLEGLSKVVKKIKEAT